MGNRHKAREIALQGLYMFEIGKAQVEDILELDWIDKPLQDDIKDFAKMLISGTIEKIEEIDSLIKKFSRNWDFNRIDAIDKTILRLAIYEITDIIDIHPTISINEAIELAKTFGGENSSQFINGILDSINKDNIKQNKI